MIRNFLFLILGIGLISYGKVTIDVYSKKGMIKILMTLQ